MTSTSCDRQPWNGQTSPHAFQSLSYQVLLATSGLVTLITYNAGPGTPPRHTTYGLRCCAAVEACNFAVGNHKDENADNSKDVIVREANKLSRDTRKNIVERALATKDQDQYRFLKLIKDRMDA